MRFSSGGGAKRCLAELVEHDVGDEVGRVEPDEIEQRQRAHRVATSELHAFVDVLDRAKSFLETADRVEQVRHEQAVDDEAAFVGRGDWFLADRLREGKQLRRMSP